MSEIKDIGLAWDRFSTPEQRSARKELAMAIFERSLLYKSNWMNGKWDGVHIRQEKLQKQAYRLEHCGDQYAVCTCTDCQTNLIGPRRCEVRICPHCVQKYARRVRERFQIIADTLPNYGKKRLAMLTLTLQVTPDKPLSPSRARFLLKCTRKLINDLYPKKLGCGALAVLEIGDGNNLHVHCLVYGEFVPQDEISRRWLAITRDSSIVDIRAVKNRKQSINYLLKYITKPPTSKGPETLALYLDVILGLRRIHTYGIFYNCKLAAKPGSSCPLCLGKIAYNGFTPGPLVPLNYKLWTECPRKKNDKKN